jgi:hypothetical protein
MSEARVLPPPGGAPLRPVVRWPCEHALESEGAAESQHKERKEHQEHKGNRRRNEERALCDGPLSQRAHAAHAKQPARGERRPSGLFLPSSFRLLALFEFFLFSYSSGRYLSFSYLARFSLKSLVSSLGQEGRRATRRSPSGWTRCGRGSGPLSDNGGCGAETRSVRSRLQRGSSV